MSFRAREKLVRCPFDPSHSIQPHRLQKHIIQCQKNHPDKKFLKCFFNATHLVTPARFTDHLKECPNKDIVERDVFRRERDAATPASYKASASVVTVTPAPPCEEDWDSELVETSYNPNKKVVYMENARRPPSGLSKSARRAWHKKENERVQRLREGRPIDDLIADEIEECFPMKAAKPNPDVAGPFAYDGMNLSGGACGGPSFSDEHCSPSRNLAVNSEKLSGTKNISAEVYKSEDVIMPAASTGAIRKVKDPRDVNVAGQGKQRRKPKLKKKQDREADWHQLGREERSRVSRGREVDGVSELMMKNLHFNEKGS